MNLSWAGPPRCPCWLLADTGDPPGLSSAAAWAAPLTGDGTWQESRVIFSVSFQSSVFSRLPRSWSSRRFLTVDLHSFFPYSHFTQWEVQFIFSIPNSTPRNATSRSWKVCFWMNSNASTEHPYTVWVLAAVLLVSPPLEMPTGDTERA